MEFLDGSEWILVMYPESLKYNDAEQDIRVILPNDEQAVFVKKDRYDYWDYMISNSVEIQSKQAEQEFAAAKEYLKCSDELAQAFLNSPEGSDWILEQYKKGRFKQGE